ncbi:hypothetical protein ACROYT_G014993 [Oculina patagonica]
MAEGRFASVSSVEEFILEQENEKNAKKTERDVKLLERFLITKNEDRKIEDIPAVELNEYISQFIIAQFFAVQSCNEVQTCVRKCQMILWILNFASNMNESIETGKGCKLKCTATELPGKGQANADSSPWVS